MADTVSIDVLLGNGDGTFGGRTTYAVGFAERVAVGDFNGDGRVDIVVPNQLNVGVLLGNGNGTFQAQRTLAVQTLRVVVADMNRDGRLDLVTQSGVMLGNGDGTFGAPITFGASGFELSVADINGDGKPDVLATDLFGHNVGVSLGNGDGTVGVRQTFGVGTYPYGVVGADVNGDGRADLVAVNAGPHIGPSNISVLLANSDGSFAGQKYTIGASANTVSGTGGNDTITLTWDADNGDVIDWSMGTVTGQVWAEDPSGLTINGGGGTDSVVANYSSSGSALPDTVHLNGTFFVGGSPFLDLAGKNLEIGRSTVYFGNDNPAMILAALAAGYNGGAWNGAATPVRGVITSLAAENNPNGNTGIGWANSSDGTGVNTTPNSIELKYTLVGDVNLDGAVNITDVNALVPHYNSSGAWTGGDFNYDGLVNITDVNALVPNYNTSLGSQVQAATSDGLTVGVTAEAVNGTKNLSVPSWASASTESADNSVDVLHRKGKVKRQGHGVDRE